MKNVYVTWTLDGVKTEKGEFGKEIGLVKRNNDLPGNTEVVKVYYESGLTGYGTVQTVDENLGLVYFWQIEGFQE